MNANIMKTVNRAEDPAVDSIVPGDKWVFDDNVAKCFSDMLSKSIPAYEQMRTLTFNLGKNFLRPSRHVIDLGASRGDAIAPFVDYSHAKYKHPGDHPIFHGVCRPLKLIFILTINFPLQEPLRTHRHQAN